MFRCTIPEGVEVKLSADLIRPIIVSDTKDSKGLYLKQVINAQTFSSGRYESEMPENFEQFTKSITDSCLVTAIQTKGKFMYWTFNNSWFMMNTFGMTGQWSTDKGKHPCFAFSFQDGTNIYFNDHRHFGTIKFTNSQNIIYNKLLELGWDPLKNKLSLFEKKLKKTIMKSKKPIGQLLMDQKIFAGVGNYIRAEALYLSKISPWRLGNNFSEQDIDLLCSSVINIMEESYKYQGATIQTYKTALGAEGKYSSCFKVYGQKTDPLGNKIITEDTPDGRTIHWCPEIQK